MSAFREKVLSRLHEERFQDRSPAAVYATLLDEGEYLCSISSMHRLLKQHGETRERRDQRTHPSYKKPELLATAPNQLWSWDISRPHVSNDNPYSESQFRTLKYRPELPDGFGCIQDSRAFCQGFFRWYNGEHRHSGQRGREREQAGFERPRWVLRVGRSPGC
jgi:Integrase core domain